MRYPARFGSLIVLAGILALGWGAVCGLGHGQNAPPLEVSAWLNPSILPPSNIAELKSTVTGGVPGYTYAWRQTLGPTVTIETPSMATSNVFFFAGPGQHNFVLRVTDSVGTWVDSLAVVTTVP